ncbi:hypothetical protein AMTRI_Chr02g264940 [Amborella trichopoda]
MAPGPEVFAWPDSPNHREETILPLLFAATSLLTKKPCPSSHRSSFLLCTPALEGGEASEKVFHGECFVLDHNIDADQIILAEYLTLVPSNQEEYEKLGSLALVGLPSRYPRFVAPG